MPQKTKPRAIRRNDPRWKAIRDARSLLNAALRTLPPTEGNSPEWDRLLGLLEVAAETLYYGAPGAFRNKCISLVKGDT